MIDEEQVQSVSNGKPIDMCKLVERAAHKALGHPGSGQFTSKLDLVESIRRGYRKALADEEHSWFKGRRGVWRTLPNRVHIFIPDDATSEEIDSIIDRFEVGGEGDVPYSPGLVIPGFDLETGEVTDEKAYRDFLEAREEYDPELGHVTKFDLEKEHDKLMKLIPDWAKDVVNKPRRGHIPPKRDIEFYKEHPFFRPAVRKRYPDYDWDSIDRDMRET